MGQSRWDTMVTALMAFKKRHGHCNVSYQADADPRLRVWLHNLRNRRQKGLLDSERVKELDRLGIVWEPQEQQWQGMYAALIEYKRKHGDCKVPHQWPKNRQLASWVGRMRLSKKRKELPKDRVRKLNQIGFIWEPFQHHWESMYLALVEFQREHGHCRIPNSSRTHKQLGDWIRAQRANRRKGRLSRGQIRKLDRLGFTWEILAG